MKSLRLKYPAILTLLLCAPLGLAEKCELPLFVSDVWGGQHGVLRMRNPSEENATLEIHAIDDGGVRAGPVVPNVVQAPADETGTNPVTLGEGLAKRYFAAIGRVVLANHAGDDVFSNPDIFVRVQRRDLDILTSIHRAQAQISAFVGQGRAVHEELQPLREKQRDSELSPGEPLSATRAARLDELFRDLGDVCDDSSRRATCNTCSRYDERPVCAECEACDELRFLQEKKAASEIVPGPALTPQERQRLQELEGTSARIASDQQKTELEKKRLWDSITGETHTITTPGYILDFEGRVIQEVFPGDEVWISVYDRDMGKDDPYGSTSLRIGDVAMGGGDVELTMPNVESLILRIISR